ncbi:MAG TPA: CopG family transcriptional regulator [Acidimicrobiales bacterium]|nr:CopG family transcriptional regulator [Acidimicrobiales bacterium]
MARTQTLVQLSDDLLARLDSRASREGRSRSDLIRRAIAAYLADDAEAAIDGQLAAAYAARPQDDVDHDWAALTAIASDDWSDVE